MSTPKPALASIRIVDVRHGGPLRHALEARARARALRDACLAFFPRPARPLVGGLDRLTRHWLMRSDSPYLAEIAAIAQALGFPGVWFLNGSYQWACTALACEQNGVPWLARTLDWPFSGLGRHAELARMRGPAGDFWSVTWPGYVGVLTAMAPGRFAVALNQAPLWRRTRHPWLRLYDIPANAAAAWWRVRHIPPDQLLRRVCETCTSFPEAKQRLETVPVARPAIFTLVGCVAGERCVIERTEESFASRSDDTAAANDWLVPLPRWEARIGSELVLVCSTAEAAERSRRRREALAGWQGRLSHDSFAWIVPPVLNPCTRIGAEMCPATGTLRVVGYEKVAGCELPQAVTMPCEVTSVAA